MEVDISFAQKVILVAVGYVVGYIFRGMLERFYSMNKVSTKGAEILWFNTESWQWERPDDNSNIGPRDRVVLAVPLKPKEEQ